MNSNVRGWLFDPILSEAARAAREREQEEERQFIRLHSGPVENWCTCSMCASLNHPLDNICCKSDKTVVEWLKDQNFECISKHPGFESTILNEHVLNMIRHDTLRYVTDKDKRKELLSGSAKSKRFIAYRNFVSWINSGKRLGKNNRVRLPACVVKLIRQKWPEPSGVYVGFKISDEEHMSLNPYSNI
jgi:hypothetical protein